MNNIKWKMMASIVMLSFMMPAASYAALSGGGSFGNPVTGNASPGDVIPLESYVRNLSKKHLSTVFLDGVYEANTYNLVFDASGGHFENGDTKIEQKVLYDSILEPPGDPIQDGKVFAGWYLKGNGQGEGNGADTILKDGSIFQIAADDAGDMNMAKADENGNPMAQAVWREQCFDPADGAEADMPPGGVPESSLDPWGAQNAANTVLEWVPSCPDKDSYRKLHGKTSYQYGRVAFSARTDQAAAYHWFVKRPGRENFDALEETGPVLSISQIRREDHGNIYRCEVELDAESHIVYETALTVYNLPDVQGTAIKLRGELL